jgi:hypothetical protein
MKSPNAADVSSPAIIRTEALLGAFLAQSSEVQFQILDKLSDVAPAIAVAMALACRQTLAPPASIWIERAGRDAGYRAILRQAQQAILPDNLWEVVLETVNAH